MGKLTNKVAVVTGGNSGIGFATAQSYLAEGAQVVITGRRPEAVEEAVQQLGSSVHGIVADQSSLQDLDQLVAGVSAKFGKVDVLFINAGVAAFAPIEAVTEDLFDNIMNTNFKGAYFTLQKFIPLLTEGASVTLLSSINAQAGMPNSSVYAASKAALNSLLKTATLELSERKIRVNAVSPGPVSTPIFDKLGMPEDAVAEFGTAMSQRVPLHTFGKPEEIAKLVTFLSSDEASFITGSDYVIDGGLLVNPILG